MLNRLRPRLDPFVPTGWDLVGKIIDFAGPGEDSVVVDLGSGDGRLVIEAAKRYGSLSMGIELNPHLVEIAKRRAGELRLENVAFLNTDVRVVSLQGVTHIVAYLTSRALKKIEHVLLTAPKDAVIVTHNYPIRGWIPIEVLETWSSSDGKLHRLYKYTPRLSAPASKQARPPETRALRLDTVLNSLKARHL
ncbi:tRNA (guanine-N(7)-)-methyltransferase [Candidatus Calditenuaceae archaeon HR02]|nr:tRNA (guanine-N(7)-)-methyltransferase [Candidatus Calditenuaceae archaeon HR02]